MEKKKSFDDYLGNDYDMLNRRISSIENTLNRLAELSNFMKTCTVENEDCGCTSGASALFGELLRKHVLDAAEELERVEISVKSMRENANRHLRGMNHDLNEMLMWRSKERQGVEAEQSSWAGDLKDMRKKLEQIESSE